MKTVLRAGLLLWLAAAAWGVNWKALKPEGYVSDFAQVIDPASKQQLENYCTIVQRTTGAEIALVTVPTLDGEPIEDVANTIFDTWGVGKKGTNEGILMLLAIGERKSRLEVGYGLEPILPDGFAGSILRDMRPALREARYGEAMMAAAQTIGETVAKEKNVSLPAELPRRTERRGPALQTFPWPLLVGGILFLLLLVGRGGRGGYGGRGGGGGTGLLAGILLGQMMGRGGGGWGRGSGGFGGFDSGGGFGGFGGGSSGGGGASSGW